MKKKRIFFTFAVCAVMIMLFSLCASADDGDEVASNTTRGPTTASSAAVASVSETTEGTAEQSEPSQAQSDEGTVDPETGNGEPEGSNDAVSGDDPEGDTTTEASPVLTVPAQETVTTGWQTTDGYKYYYKDDGTCYKNTFATIDNKLYYFDSEGHLLYGANKYIDGYYYFSDPDGVVSKSTAWHTSADGKTYYSASNGRLYQSIRTRIGRYYYYFDSDASLLKAAVYKYGGNYYYAGSNGVNKAYAGWFNLGDERYYAGSGGVLVRSARVKMGRYYYCFRSNAALVRGALYIYRGNLYYGGAGTGLTKAYPGWFNLDGDRYYAGSGGVIVHSTRTKISGNYYCFNSNGSLIKNTVYRYGGNYYYAGSDGVNKAYSGWVTLNGKRYYASSNGTLYHDQFIHSIDQTTGDPVYYYVGSDASVQTGSFTVSGTAYTTDSNGVINEEVNASTVANGSSGIDVSEFQGVINWAKVKAAGIKFAFIRVGGRGYTSGSIYQDAMCMTNLQNAIAAGIKVGVYFFSQARTTAEAYEEVDSLHTWINGYNITLPVVIDTEYADGARANSLSAKVRTYVVKAFGIRAATYGYTSMVYASTSWLNNQLIMSLIPNYQVWVAEWTTASKPSYNGDYTCWQYSSKGSVDGISGNVDMNTWNSTGSSLNDSLITD